MSSLSDVTILVTSFLRHGYLLKCLEGLAANLPECKVVIVDDSNDAKIGGLLCNHGPQMAHLDWKIILMYFDSGLSMKRNVGVQVCRTKYLLLGADDFDFSTKEAREGIEVMLATLDRLKGIDIAGGRVDSRPYEGFLDYVPGSHIQEIRLQTDGMRKGDVALCDLTVNYFLARTQVLKAIPWDENIRPIGGEHGDWFLTVKETGRKVAYIHGANITTLHLGPEAQHPDYAKYRSRAVTHGHRIFMEKRNIREYLGF